MTTKSEMGKKSRLAGARFELKVRADLEKQGWIVDKWTNNVEFKNYYEDEGFKIPHLSENQNKLGKMHPAKSFRGITRSSGFPDFIAFRQCRPTDHPNIWKPVDVIAVESKMNGVLTKLEKEKCQWYLDNNIFSRILIAFKGESRGEIVYKMM